MAGTSAADNGDRICTHCGKPVAPDRKSYCNHCGEPLPAQFALTAAPARHTSSRGWIIVAALLAAGTYAWFSGALASFVPGVAPGHCVVGLNGAAVSVAVDGPGAMAQCNSFLTRTTDGGTWYLYANSNQPGGAMICQVAYAGDEWAVRDEGALDLYGTSICQNLINLANRPSAPPAVGQPSGAAATECGLQVQGANATIMVTTNVCSAFAAAYPPAGGATWVSIDPTGGPPTADRNICDGAWSGAQVSVWDSGGAYYGSDLCQRLGWTSQ